MVSRPPNVRALIKHLTCAVATGPPLDSPGYKNCQYWLILLVAMGNSRTNLMILFFLYDGLKVVTYVPNYLTVIWWLQLGLVDFKDDVRRLTSCLFGPKCVHN